VQLTELSQDQLLLDGGEDRFDQRSLGQTSLLPFGDEDLTDSARGRRIWLVTAISTTSERSRW